VDTRGHLRTLQLAIYTASNCEKSLASVRGRLFAYEQEHSMISAKLRVCLTSHVRVAGQSLRLTCFGV
jgi:hypothetical protein